MLQQVLESTDGTVKYLYRLEDGATVETVLVPFIGRDAVCLSSQVGCAMACSFCHTGMQGFQRHLTTAEITGQYRAVWDWMQTHRPHRSRPNVVFMGQGEPLHNFEASRAAVAWFIDPRQGKLGPRQVTVSTSGYLPGIERFAEFGGVNFALSLHSPRNSERASLIPLNMRWPLEELFAAIRRLPLRSQQFINCEYLVIQDLNHSAAHADELAQLVAGLRVLVNLIPFNPFPGSTYRRPGAAEIAAFKVELIRNRLRVFTRTTKGADIMAACGQLNTATVTA